MLSKYTPGQVIQTSPIITIPQITFLWHLDNNIFFLIQRKLLLLPDILEQRKKYPCSQGNVSL
jgi:hypothetical protein